MRRPRGLLYPMASAALSYKRLSLQSLASEEWTCSPEIEGPTNLLGTAHKLDFQVEGEWLMA